MDRTKLRTDAGFTSVEEFEKAGALARKVNAGTATDTEVIEFAAEYRGRWNKWASLYQQAERQQAAAQRAADPNLAPEERWAADLGAEMIRNRAGKRRYVAERGDPSLEVYGQHSGSRDGRGLARIQSSPELKAMTEHNAAVIRGDIPA